MNNIWTELTFHILSIVQIVVHIMAYYIPKVITTMSNTQPVVLCHV